MNDVADRAFRRHYDQVYRYVRRRTHDHHRAEELTQQVFADAAASLRQALAALPEGQRQVVVLKLLRGVRFAEIAEQLGLSEAAAKMRFVRALEALRAELEREGVTP